MLSYGDFSVSERKSTFFLVHALVLAHLDPLLTLLSSLCQHLGFRMCREITRIIIVTSILNLSNQSRNNNVILISNSVNRSSVIQDSINGLKSESLNSEVMLKERWELCYCL